MVLRVQLFLNCLRTTLKERTGSLFSRLRLLDSKIRSTMDGDSGQPAEAAAVKRLQDDGNEDDSNAKRLKSEAVAATPTNRTTAEVVDDVEHQLGAAAECLRRKKVAMLLAYSGLGYYGMQRNRDVSTIEGTLLDALLKIGLITRENCDVPQTMHFQRAARTDKGVSAARQVVSLRIVFNDGLVEQINAQLPPQIRVFDIKRGTKGFNSKLWCDARSYSYTFPTFALAPITEVSTNEYRISGEILDRVNELLEEFKGTHNFHNFTSGRKFSDKSAHRYIMDFKCDRPFLEGELELIVLTVKGQSFMLHQIRKMIGLVIAIMRDLANRDFVTRAYGDEKLDIPIAPGVGLVLEQVHYDKYNLRYGSDGLHEALDWTEFSKNIDRFRKEYIYPTIVRAETEEKSMLQWLATLPLHTYDVREAGQNPPLRAALNKLLNGANDHANAVLPDEVTTDETETVVIQNGK